MALPDSPCLASHSPCGERIGVADAGCGCPAGATWLVPTDFPTLEAALGKTAIRELAPPQPGDVPDTWASTARLAAATGWRPQTPVAEGVRRFADWFLDWHRNRGNRG